MKKDSPTSDPHEELKALLASSFHSEEADDTPPLPQGLRDRIRDQYSKKATTSVASPETQSFFEKLFSLFKTPAYAGAAAALVLLAVVAVVLNLDNNREVMRGGSGEKTAVTIYLVGLDDTARETLNNSKLFAEDALKVATLTEALNAANPKIIVNGESDTIQGFTAGGTAAQEKPFPADSSLADHIAETVAELGAEE